MKAFAWMMPITDTVSVAVGQFELVHVLPDQPTLFTVPKTPAYCQHVLFWQNKVVPVMNLATRFNINLPTSQHDTHHILAIFAYRSETTKLIDYGALIIKDTPRHIEVDDAQATTLPTDLITWSPYIVCCFQDTSTKQTIPILKLESLFAAPS